jgi:hypothetical protein
MAVALFSIMVSLILIIIIALRKTIQNWIMRKIAYFHTRNIPPAVGQNWDQKGLNLEIDRIDENGNITIRLAIGTSFIDTPERWKLRVKNHKLFLISQN